MHASRRTYSSCATSVSSWVRNIRFSAAACGAQLVEYGIVVLHVLVERTELGAILVRVELAAVPVAGADAAEARLYVVRTAIPDAARVLVALTRQDVVAALAAAVLDASLADLVTEGIRKIAH